MKRTTILKRAEAFLLSLVLVAGMALNLMPQPVQAAGKEGDDPASYAAEGEPFFTSVTYGEDDTATITYHKEGISPQPLNLIFLVERSEENRGLYPYISTAMGGDMGSSASQILFSTVEERRVELLQYSNQVNYVSVTSAGDLFTAFRTDTGWEGSNLGTPNEVNALELAAARVNAVSNTDPTVVVWVPGSHVSAGGYETELAELKSALDSKNGALITWEQASSPNALLAQYADEANAAGSGTQVGAGLQDTVRKLCLDHYENVSFTLSIPENMTLAESIIDAQLTSTYKDWGHPYLSDQMSTSISGDGKSVTVNLIRVNRESDLDLTVTVSLREGAEGRETVFPELSVSAQSGGLYTGVRNETVIQTDIFQLPKVELEVMNYTISFQLGEEVTGDVPETITARAGEQVTLPDGTGLSMEGSAFGGWNVTESSADDAPQARTTPGEHRLPCQEGTSCLRPSSGIRS